jgi:hypothetical protein
LILYVSAPRPSDSVQLAPKVRNPPHRLNGGLRHSASQTRVNALMANPPYEFALQEAPYAAAFLPFGCTSAV